MSVEPALGAVDPIAASVDRGEGFLVVRDAGGLDSVLAALSDAEEIGIDCETTGLDPRKDRVRLLQLAIPTIDGSKFVYVIDVFQVNPSPLFETLAEKVLVGHNLGFDLSFLAGLGFATGKVADTMLLSLLLDGSRQGKGYHGLGQVAARELGVTLDKGQQQSDWAAPALAEEQLRYAARDAAVLLPLHRALSRKVAEAGMTEVAEIEARCLPAVAWLSRSGVAFDHPVWVALAGEAEREAQTLAPRLAAQAPPRPETIPGVKAKLKPGPWNWRSPPQVKAAFTLLGIDLPDTTDDTLAGIDHPLAALLRKHRSAEKLSTTYGAGWLKGAFHQGRLYAGWRQLGCITGRMSSATPNLQNLPGDVRYRRCFQAPEGRVLVMADYSQIELRIAAKVTGDRAMLEAYRTGQDLHTLTARRMTGRDEVSKEERKLAKPVNFGLIYGLSAASLRSKAKAEYGLDLTPQEAEQYRRAFFDSYPGVAAWHRRLRAESAPAVRTLAGRRCVLPEKHFYGTRANYVVQGTGGDGIKVALALLWERRHQCPGAFPILAIHDEIVVEADAAQKEAAAAWLKGAMVDAMTPLLDPVPVEVEVKISWTWGGE